MVFRSIASGARDPSLRKLIIYLKKAWMVRVKYSFSPKRNEIIGMRPLSPYSDGPWLLTGSPKVNERTVKEKETDP